MKKNLLCVIFLTLCTFLNSCGAQMPGSETEQVAEPVTLTFFVRNESTYMGLQEDPVAEYIKERFGIEIVLMVDENLGNTSAYSGTYSELLQTKLVSGDLADIIDFGSTDDDASVVKNLQDAARLGIILPLDALVEEYAPHLNSDSRLTIRNEYRKAYVYGDGDFYSLGSWGGVERDQLPEAANWIRWDLYKKMDYPEVETDKEFLMLLEQMQQLYPETPSGEKVYGLGCALAETEEEGGAVLWDYPLSKGFGSVEGSYAVYLDYADEMLTFPITDPDSFLWEGIQFFYEAKKMGVLDPDSITMDNENLNGKINRGLYLASLNGCDVMNKEGILAGKGISNAGYMPLPILSDVKMFPFYKEDILGTNELAISSQCRHPDKAIEFLDWCFTDEGSRILTQGTEGLSWVKKSGTPVLTDAYCRDVSLGIADLAETYGTLKYAGISGFKRNALDQKGMYIQPEEELLPQKYTTIEKDAASFYQTDNLSDYFADYKTKKGESLPEIAWSSYLSSIGPIPQDLEEKMSEIQNYMEKAVIRCIQASDDESFMRIKNEIIDYVKQTDIDEVAQWYNSRFLQVRDALKPELETALQAYVLFG